MWNPEQKFQEFMSPPLCPVPHRGEGVNKVGCMNFKMFVMITGNSTIVLQ